MPVAPPLPELLEDAPPAELEEVAPPAPPAPLDEALAVVEDAAPDNEVDPSLPPHATKPTTNSALAGARNRREGVMVRFDPKAYPKGKKV
jgi:hypothetical protein